MNEDMKSFIKKSAKFMAADRPDLWDKDKAKIALKRWIPFLKDNGDFTGSGSFLVFLHIDHEEDGGGKQYSLVRSIYDVNIYDDDDNYEFDWIKGSAVWKS